jgi:hypothetical protein
MNRFENITKPLMWSTTLLLAAIVAGCGGSGNGIPGATSTTTSAGSGGAGVVGGACAGASCVNLGTAANYVILAKTGVSTVPNSVVTGNIGLSPAAESFLTGWSQTDDATRTYATSPQVTGKLYAADMIGGTTSSDLSTAVGDMQTAYTAAAGMALAGGGLITACPGAGALGGLTVVPGVYKCAVNVGIATGTNLVLNGTSTDVWVFEITGTLTQAAATQVQLTGGALAKNVFWQVSSSVDVGTTALMQGVILGQTLINLQSGATENGRLLAQTAVTLNQNTVTRP